MRENKNNETRNHPLLCFSPSCGRVVCYICKLMTKSDLQLCKEGFSDLKYCRKLEEHEASKEHLRAVVRFAAIKKNLFG